VLGRLFDECVVRALVRGFMAHRLSRFADRAFYHSDEQPIPELSARLARERFGDGKCPLAGAICSLPRNHIDECLEREECFEILFFCFQNEKGTIF
jgi:hypothetical protein